MGKTAIWAISCFCLLEKQRGKLASSYVMGSQQQVKLASSYVMGSQQRAKLASSYAMGSQHCIGGEGIFKNNF